MTCWRTRWPSEMKLTVEHTSGPRPRRRAGGEGRRERRRAGRRARRRRHGQRGRQRSADAERRPPATDAGGRAGRIDERLCPGAGHRRRSDRRHRADSWRRWSSTARPGWYRSARPATATSPSTPVWGSTPTWSRPSRISGPTGRPSHQRPARPADVRSPASPPTARPGADADPPGGEPVTGAATWSLCPTSIPGPISERRPVRTNPGTSAAGGLGVFALTSLTLPAVARVAGQLLIDRPPKAGGPPAGRGPRMSSATTTSQRSGGAAIRRSGCSSTATTSAVSPVAFSAVPAAMAVLGPIAPVGAAAPEHQRPDRSSKHRQ